MIGAAVRLSTRRPAIVIAVGAALVIAAAFVARGLKLDALPDITPNQVLVLTDAPGLTPEEVEILVTRPVEQAVAGQPGLESQRSISRYGISAVTAVFSDDTDLLRARQTVQERLSALDLPEGVGAPTLGPLTGGLGEVFQFTLSSSDRTPAELLELAERRLGPVLKGVPGVVEVNTWGGHRRTLEVLADPSRLAERGVTLAELKEALGEATGAAAGASVEAGAGQALLRGVARPKRPEELEAAVVRAQRTESGLSTIRVGDVARVKSGALPRLGAATANGRGETVYVMVQMLRGSNSLELTNALSALLPKLQRLLPPDVRLDLVYDRGAMVSATLRTVGKNLLEGGLLVVAVLFLMLGSLRAGLIVAATIPLSMLVALAGMVLLGIPGTLMSLGAIDFGLLVDGAVVMVENVFHHVEEEREELQKKRSGLAALVGRVSEQVARPVFFSVTIILLVYVPVLSLTGVDGKMFRPMALTVILALLASLALSLTVVPAASRLLLRERDVPHRPPLPIRLIDRVYPPLLDVASRRPVATTGLAAGLLGLGVTLFLSAGSEFVPQLDEGDLVLQTTRRPDTSVEQAVAEATRMESALLEEVPEVGRIASRIGSPAVATDTMGLEQADVFIRLKPPSEWRPGLTKDALIREMEAILERRSPGSEPAFTQPIQMRFNEMLGGEVTDVAVSIYGEDLGELRRLADKAARLLDEVEGAEDVRVMAPPDVVVIEVRPRPVDAARAGFTAAQILDAVRAVRTGVDVGTTYDGPLALPIVLRVAGRHDAFTLAQLPLPTPDGGLIPLERVADVTPVSTPSLVSHEGAERRLVVGFNVRGADLGDLAARAQRAVDDGLSLPSGYRLEWGGQAETLRAAKQRLAVVIPAVVLLILAVLVLAFRSARPALLILSHVPFASVGGMFALALRDMPVSISAAIGFIALSGIAVLNGVVMMNQVLENERRGASPGEAALTAARARARPVLITALVAALGFVPMMLATGIGAEVQRPLATVVVGGLLTSTLLTLFLLPALYPFIPGAGRQRARRHGEAG